MSVVFNPLRVYRFSRFRLLGRNRVSCLNAFLPSLPDKISIIFARNASTSKAQEHSPLDKIRNIGISAHIDSGKTTVTERILFYTGRIDSMHEVRGKDDVGATMDFMDLERERGITIQSAATFVHWDNHSINIIDTPGHVDFTVEVERALRVLDGAILVICGASGVQSQTFTVNRQMTRYNVPFMTFINKLDRLGANHNRAIDGLRNRLGHNCAFVMLPIGLEKELAGLIDLIKMKALYFDGEQGTSIREEPIPSEYMDEAIKRKAELIECVSNVDEEIADIFLSEQEPTVEQLKAGIRRSVVKRLFSPVFCGSALKNKGVQPLLDGVIDYLPDPSQVLNYANLENDRGELQKVVMSFERNNDKPAMALAFKLEAGKFGQLTYFRVYQGCLSRGDTLYNTREKRKIRIQRLVRMHASKMEDIDAAYAGDICATFGVDCASGDTFVSDVPECHNLAMESMYIPEPVISMAMEPADRKFADNFMKALKRFTKEDPTFRTMYNIESKQTIVSGMGELHLDIYAQRMKSEYGCEVIVGKPKVAFRETLTRSIKFDYFHKKQTGGHGQYGRVIGVCEPLPPAKNTTLEFVDECIGTNIPKQYVPAIKKGYLDACEKGPLIGQKVAGILFRLQDGAHHIVDSSEIAFINTARLAMKDVFAEPSWQLIEPVMKVEVNAPKEYQGPVMATLSQRNAIIQSTSTIDNTFMVCTCEVPLNLMFGYASVIRSVTEGKGEFTMEFVRYAPMAASVQQDVIAQFEEAQESTDESSQSKKKKRKN